MKKKVYILTFTLLIALMGFIAHIIIESLVIGLLVFNFDKYNLGLNWGQWRILHHIMVAVFTVGGAYLGYLAGQKFWVILYEGKNPLYKVPFWERGKRLKDKKAK